MDHWERDVETLRPTVLLLDDESFSLELYESMVVRKTGWEVVSFTDPEEALSCVRQQTIDIMVVDWQMPTMNGVTFLQQAQEIQPDAIQALLTGHAAKDVAIHAINSLKNLHFFMEKGVGFSPRKLLVSLRSAWERRKLSLRLALRVKELEETNKRLKTAKDDLFQKKKQAVIGDLLQGICHNINSPLGTISGHAEFLSMLLADSALPAHERDVWSTSLSAMLESSQKIQGIIENLMVKSRLEQEPERKSVSINDLIRRELEFLRARPFLRDRVKCNLSLGDSLPALLLNYGDISQVVGNILENALDALWNIDEPQLLIKTSREEGVVVLEVHDNGPGVPEAIRQQVFDPFFTTKVPVDELFVGIHPEQGDTPPSVHHLKEGTAPHGSGLGLHSARRILKEYQADICVVDSDLGGACFRVSIPPQSPKNER